MSDALAPNAGAPDVHGLPAAPVHAPHADAHAGLHDHAHGFIRTYIFSLDHKMIAKQYLLLGIFFLLVAGLMALMIRAKLAYPGEEFPLVGNWFWSASKGVMPAEFYNSLFTNHGALMVFFAITPIVIGMFGNFVVPLQVGARDMIYPLLNLLSFWVLFAGALLMLISFHMPAGGAGAGWTVYAPLSSNTVALGGWGQSLFVLGIAFAGTSSLMGGINIIATVLNNRCQGLGLLQVPLATWGLFFASVLNVLWVPVVAVALFMVFLDRTTGTNFFVPEKGGQVLLYQHLFWGFGHPEVYILILPVWGLVGDLLAVFSRKPAFGYKATVYSMASIVCLSQIVWGHHMFTSGMNPLLGKGFVVLTIAISVPTAIFFLNWLGTLWRGSIRFTPPMLYCIGIIFVFAIGGLTGLFNALQALDIHLHDTYFIVGHFHYTMAASVLLGGFAGIHYWFPKLFGRRMNDTLGVIHFFLTFILINVVFAAMMYVGLGGHPRRISDPSTYRFLDPFKPTNIMMYHAAMALGLSQLIFAWNFFYSLFKGKPATDNPWEASSLEWATVTPPPHGNFAVAPIVYRGPYEFSSPEAGPNGFILQNTVPAGSAPAVPIEPEHPGQPNPATGVENYKLGMWLFLISEVMFFTALIGGYIVLRLGSTAWPDPNTILGVPVLATNTFILVCSSVTMVLGLQAIQQGKPGRAAKFLLATALCGLIFLVIKSADYHHLWTGEHPLTLSSSMFGSCYYTLTGFHGLHVLAGVVLLLIMVVRLLKGHFNPQYYAPVECVGLYWHFVDLVWIILFAILCLV